MGVEDLAIFGGRPVSVDPLHVNRPNAGERELFLSYVDSAWQSRWFTNDGPFVRELEERLQDYLQVDHCVAVSSGTSGLALVVRALGLAGEVVVPSFTFISTPHVLHWAGIQPVFCDIDPCGWTIDCDHCAQLITDSTTAVISTHLWGRACDVDRLSRVCSSAGIRLLFDAAHAFGCTYKGEPIGRFGAAEVFSFHATKVFHTFEGGAVTTNDGALAERLRKMRNFGFSGYDEVEMVGTNAKMSEIHAAMGLTNLATIDTTIARNRSCFEAYWTGLQGVHGLSMHGPDDREKSNYHYVVAEIDGNSFGLMRDQLLQVLYAENILARRYFYPGGHRSEPYRSLYPAISLPNTEAVKQRVILLPGGACMRDQDVRAVCSLIRFVGANAGAIAARLGA